MKKIFHLNLMLIALLASVTLSSYGQENGPKTRLDSASLKTDNLDSISGVYQYQEPDFLRSHSSDSTSIASSLATAKTDSGLVMKKIIRLDPTEIQSLFPDATYQYPNGKVVVDYDALVSILLVAEQQDRKVIKKLKKKVSRLDAEVKKLNSQ